MNFEMLREMIAIRRKSFMFLGFLAFLTLGLMLFLSLWQRAQLEKAQTDWFAKRDALARGQRLGTAARYQNGVRDLALFEKRYIPKKEFAGFLSRLLGTAKSNSLSLKGIDYKPAPVKESPGLVSYGISFVVSGSYPSVKSFIADLVRYPDLITVDSLTLDSRSRTEESVDMKVKITAYLKTEGA